MTDWSEASDADFRHALRTWLEENYPPAWQTTSARPFHRLPREHRIQWLRTLYASGWRAPAWPREHGGLGLPFAKQRIYLEEFARRRIARAIDFGEQMLGPVLMSYGSPEQKARLLPRILSCEDVWCQGYSEPGAGSDLAALRTTATLDGEHFTVNGQKIWTTYAHEATHIFALVRTGRFERKQQGISFLLIDLAAAGVQVRPIMNIAGEEEYCEVFFTDVRVPRAQLVGELHQGWKIAKALLGHERVWVGSPAMSRSALALARQLLTAPGVTPDAARMDDFAQLEADLHDYEALYESVCLQIAARGEPGPEVVMLKILATELQQRICEFVTELAGEHAGALGETVIGEPPPAATSPGAAAYQAAGALRVDIHWQLMMSRPITIFGGANEIQRDILAKTVLDLPGG